MQMPGGKDDYCAQLPTYKSWLVMYRLLISTGLYLCGIVWEIMLLIQVDIIKGRGKCG